MQVNKNEGFRYEFISIMPAFFIQAFLKPFNAESPNAY
jgi:hypothetical protein